MNNSKSWRQLRKEYPIITLKSSFWFADPKFNNFDWKGNKFIKPFTGWGYKEPISTFNGIALILNHLLTLFVLGSVIAYFAR